MISLHCNKIWLMNHDAQCFLSTSKIYQYTRLNSKIYPATCHIALPGDFIVQTIQTQSHLKLYMLQNNGKCCHNDGTRSVCHALSPTTDLATRLGRWFFRNVKTHTIHRKIPTECKYHGAHM